jgi:GxxExxY protein
VRAALGILAGERRARSDAPYQSATMRIAVPNGGLIDDYNADLFVDNRLITELKAAKALADEPVAEMLGYLRSSGVEHGLLIHFGAPKFEIKK